MKILIVSENATDEYGGESVLPLHYFKGLRARGEDVYLLTHARVRNRLEQIIPLDLERVIFIDETWLHSWLFKVGKKLPARVNVLTTNALSHFVTQCCQRGLASKAIKDLAIDVIHEPAPVSPRQPSALFGLGVPVVIGPMNGGMTSPSGFEFMANRFEKGINLPIKILTHFFNLLLPGKLLADVLLVANERTKKALPKFTQGKIITLIENGVDTNLWTKLVKTEKRDYIQLVYLGRLVDLKCVDLLIKAFSRVQKNHKVRLMIIGRGEEEAALKQLAIEEGVELEIDFLGWKSHEECTFLLANSDVLVLPSVKECGGAVVLEAMSVGLAVIAVNWGGPIDYITDKTGVLVDAPSPVELTNNLTAAIEKLVLDERLRISLGASALERIHVEFSWDKKIDKILEIYQAMISSKLANN
ncbi:MAG: glycosyltransferase family 4 protein [Cycloclasticus sp.]|nr:glycosyltransferase family 4 protein [Cycloclasticus sp.]